MPHPTSPCRHLHTDGRPCGSPALRGEPFCFYHHTARKPMPRRDLDDRLTPQLPAPDDFLAIQRAIGEVLRLLATDDLPIPCAQALLRGLAIASTNLARHHRREEKRAALAAALGTPTPQPVTDYTNHPQHGTLAPEAPADTQPVEGETQSVRDQSVGDQSVADQSSSLPDPIPLLTPDPSRATSYDQAMFTEIHQHFSAIFRDKLQLHEQKKSAELEALYEDRYAQREAELQARHNRPAPLPVQTCPQQNEDFETCEQNHLALAS